jgi:multidrug resistance efflux pump
MELVTARAKVAVAHAELESAVRSAEAARAQDAAETATLTEQWHDAETEAGARVDMIQTMTRRTKMSGVVLWQSRPGAASVWPEIIATVIDPTEIVFTGYATERQVAFIELGEHCEVELPALAGRSVEGSVVAVSVTSDDLSSKYGLGTQDEWERTRCSVYDVHIKLKLGGDTSLFQGMTGTAEVVVGRECEGVVLPSACCAERGGVYWALVREGGEWRERRLRVAAFDARHVAVSKGVTDGESVAILER